MLFWQKQMLNHLVLPLGHLLTQFSCKGSGLLAASAAPPLPPPLLILLFSRQGLHVALGGFEPKIFLLQLPLQMIHDQVPLPHSPFASSSNTGPCTLAGR